MTVPPSTNKPISVVSLAHISPSPPQNDSNEHSSSSPSGVNANDDKHDSNNRSASSEDATKYNQNYNERGKVEKEQRMRLYVAGLRYERQQQRKSNETELKQGNSMRWNRRRRYPSSRFYKMTTTTRKIKLPTKQLYTHIRRIRLGITSKVPTNLFSGLFFKNGAD